MKNLVAAALLGMASVAAFAQVQVTPAQVQVTAPKVTTAQTAQMPAPAMAPANNEGNSEMGHAEHKHNHHPHHHHKKAMEMDKQG